MSDLVRDLDTRRLLPAVGVAAVGGALLLSLLRRWRRDRRLPPGPTGLPLLGCLPWMRPSQFHLTVLRWCRQYGDLISFRIGGQLFVVVNSYDAVKEMLDDETFAGKPKTKFSELITDGGCGIVVAEGPSWQHHRRTALRILRDFGFARLRSADMVDAQIDIIQELLDESSAAGRPLRILDTFTEATNGIIASLTLGRRFERHDPEFRKINDLTRQFFSAPVFLNFVFTLPFWLARLLPSARSLIDVAMTMNEFVRQQVRLREAAMVDEEAEPECLCDAYIQERRRAERAGDFETYREMQIVRVIVEFFFAGTDTTARTLEWLFLYMSRHPDVLRRVQQELDANVDRSRRPGTADRQRLHFVNAVIEETYRTVGLAALGIVHRAVRDATFRGRLIPSDALILPFVYGCSRDPRCWDQPDQYRPERFLDDDARFKGPGKNVPFLVGRRSCAGESLARLEVFLMFTAIAQRYDVRFSDECADRADDILQGSIGLLRTPGDHRLVFSRR